jgi:hypothetical protein
LNYFLGADEYDRLFVGFEILHIENEVLTLSVRPACTGEVQDKYSWHVAVVAEALLRQAIRKVIVMHLVNVQKPTIGWPCVKAPEFRNGSLYEPALRERAARGAEPVPPME